MKSVKLIKNLILASGIVSICITLTSLVFLFIYGYTTKNTYLNILDLIFFLIFIILAIYFIVKNKVTIIKNPNKFTFYNYNEQKLINVYLDKEYSGEGYSGLTDGVEVNGKLINVEIQHDSATIWDKKRNMPCAVKLKTLKEI